MVKIIFILILTFNPLFSQTFFDYFFTSRFSRAIGLGSSYIGVAEGVETTFYNSAGLAFNNSFGLAYSYGNGLQMKGFDSNPFDVGVILPNHSRIGSFALSSHQLIMRNINVTNSIYQLHYGRLLSSNFSAGISLNYYYQKIDYSPEEFAEIKNTTQALDASLSVLYRIKNLFFSGDKDRLKLGCQLNNLFSAEIEKLIQILEGEQEDALMQSLGTGISYYYNPKPNEANGFDPITILLASDFILDNKGRYESYQFDRLHLNFGFELTFLEVLALRYGRENQFNLDESEPSDPQYPISRYGIGLGLPLQKLFYLKKDISFQFDYTYSDWYAQCAVG
jgi:hypothetical protein